MPTTLDRILADTRATLPSLRARRAQVERAAADAPEPPEFSTALRGPSIHLIAEVKRRSPSAGQIQPAMDPAAHAEAYAIAGASAISVLTDGPHFGGSLADLEAVALRVRIPVLRKDFILDEVQVIEARAAGASAVLLIVRALKPARLGELADCVRRWRIGALVEVHDASELDIALDHGAGVIGINSRNLDDFHIDVEAAWRLIARVPTDTIAVAESGMATPADVERAARAGADAVLIGTALSAAPSPGELVAGLVRIPRLGR